MSKINIVAAAANNLKHINVDIARNAITAITGVSGAGKSSLVNDVILRESQRRFLQTMALGMRKHIQELRKPKVQSIANLSPALILPQAAVAFPPHACVGSITRLGEYLQILFASCGERLCPQHNLPTQAQSSSQVAANLLQQYPNKTLVVAAQLASCPDDWQALKHKYLRVIVDGKLYSLDDDLPATGSRYEVVVDAIKVKPSTAQRLERSIQQSTMLGKGFSRIYLFAPSQLTLLQHCSAQDSCPRCGFSWQGLEYHDFDRYDRGACPVCEGKGSCRDCAGTGMRKELEAIKIQGVSWSQMQALPLTAIPTLLAKLRHGFAGSGDIGVKVCARIKREISQLVDLGLGQLTAARTIATLSSGQKQKIRFATLISEEMSGVIYIFDEPSQSLADQDVAQLLAKIKQLKQRSNTVLIVDHHPLLLNAADQVIALGPRAGKEGGQVVAYQPIKPSAVSSQVPRQLNFFSLTKVAVNNIKIKEAQFALQAINVVTGVSGAGKSSLVEHCLYKSLQAGEPHNCAELRLQKNFNAVKLIKHRASSSNNLVCAQLGILPFIRNLFSRLRSSQIAGFQAKDFGIRGGNGRCQHCKGLGSIAATVSYLPATTCPVCAGSRYNDEIQSIYYRQRNISDVLALTIAEAADFFRNFAKLHSILTCAQGLGLGYIQLGRSLLTLSGGEVQRLNLVPYLSLSMSDMLLIIDEPARGLHPHDVQRLCEVFARLCQQKVATLVLVDYNQHLIAKSDWLIEL
ncbi:MAG: hypothetical protein OYH77_01145 [Pseudomonadota bacterium]|nr:hypothetical protein [Pseudomonadota bacterium]